MLDTIFIRIAKKMYSAIVINLLYINMDYRIFKSIVKREKNKIFEEKNKN
jgi:hypothetical protein